MYCLCNFNSHWKAQVSSTAMTTQVCSLHYSSRFIKWISICTPLWTITVVISMLRKTALCTEYQYQQKKKKSSFTYCLKKNQNCSKSFVKRQFSTYWLNAFILVLFRTSVVHNKYAHKINVKGRKHWSNYESPLGQLRIYSQTSEFTKSTILDQ